MRKALGIACMAAASVWFYHANCQTTDAGRNTGWLMPGNASFSFRHRLTPTTDTNPFLEQAFRGEFLFGFRKPIYTGTVSETDLSVVAQLPFAGFEGRKIILPAATFRVELGYTHLLGTNGLFVHAGLIHFSTHLMDDVPIRGISDAVAAARLKLSVEALNVLQFGIGFQHHQDHTVLTDFGGEGGFQPIRITYFLFTEASQAFDRTSYVPYDHRVYAKFFAGRAFGWFRLTLIASGEAERNVRGTMEIRWSTKLHAVRPLEDGFQIFFSYDGGVGENEITVTPWSGMTRGNWLTGGIRLVI